MNRNHTQKESRIKIGNRTFMLIGALWVLFLICLIIGTMVLGNVLDKGLPPAPTAPTP